MGSTTRRRCGPAAAAQQGPASSVLAPLINILYIIFYILIYISQSTKFKENISELRTINIIKISHYLNNIIVCRSLLNLGLGGAAPGITAGV